MKFRKFYNMVCSSNMFTSFHSNILKLSHLNLFPKKTTIMWKSSFEGEKTFLQFNLPKNLINVFKSTPTRTQSVFTLNLEP